MIKSFRCLETERIFGGLRSRKLPGDIQKVAFRKLLMIDAATSLDLLREPPGNRLESLQGDRLGQHSIRINDQWRICFAWQADGAHNVEIVDYH